MNYVTDEETAVQAELEEIMNEKEIRVRLPMEELKVLLEHEEGTYFFLRLVLEHEEEFLGT